MTTFIYLLKVNMAIAVFYLIYRTCYRRDTFFTLRRYLLLSMLALSASYPFLDISQWLIHSTALKEVAVTYIQYMPEFTISASTSTAPSSYSFENYALLLYITIVGILLVRLIVRLSRIIWFRLHCIPIKIKNQQAYLLQNKTNPFSFFNWIFINPSIHRTTEMDEILTHELVHVHQYHSIDILFSEIIGAFCWFNPLAWMLKGEIRRNLEFIVDYQVIKSGIDSKSYQYHLLRLARNPSQAIIANQFNVSPLKERIIMLNTKQSSKIKLIAYTLLLPLTFLFLVANSAGAMVDKISSSSDLKSVIIKASEVVSTKENNPVTTNLSKYTPQPNGFEVSGILIDENNKILSGVNIIICGTNSGTISDSDGQFTIKVNEGDSLFFSHIGYTTIGLAVKNKQENVGTLQMQKKRENLNEVVVVAFGNNASVPKRNKQIATANEEVFQVVEEMPSFPGGQTELMNFIAKTIKYPESALNNNIQGRVICSFIIDPSGMITDAKVIRGVDSTLDSEALRVIYSMPYWKPGKQRGKTVAVEYTLPVNFRLQGASPEKETLTNAISENMKSEHDTFDCMNEKLLVCLNGYTIPKTSIQQAVSKHIDTTITLKNQYTYAESDGIILITIKNATLNDYEKS